MGTLPDIEAQFGEYDPPFDVVKVVRDLVAPVPERYLRGLRKVVIVDSGSLSRRDRVGKVWSRNRKYPKDRILGRYHYDNGQPWIEIRSDRAIGAWRGLPRILKWLSLMRYIMIGDVFYHELGHHIHRTIRPEFSEKEDVADNWSRKLMANFIRKRYWYLLPVLLPVSWTLRKMNWKPRSQRGK